MSESAKRFIQSGEADVTPPTQEEQARTDALRQELLGSPKEPEASVRFTVDLPKSLHRRLDQLSLDSSKPKTELVRVMIRQALDSLDY